MKGLNLENHLTDEQFTACLDGTPPQVELQTHLGACEQCQTEMEIFQTSLANFGGAAFGWSKARPVPSLRPVVLAKRRVSIAIGLQRAVAAMLLVGVGVPILVYTEHHRHPISKSVATSSSDDSESQIAQDNAILASVDRVLASTDPSPFQQYDLLLGPQKRTTSHTPSRAQ